MTNFKKQAFGALAASALLLNLAVPAAFAEGMTLTVTGNGSDSESKIKVESDTTTNVVQENNAAITNNIQATSNSGDNDANRNTGGNVTVDTGDADTDVNVSNTANSNQAEIDCCQPGDVNVEVSGNGDYSENKVKLDLDNTTNLYQTNSAAFSNNVDAKSNTGKNDAERNTGGDVEVKTGDASTSVYVSNTANANSAKIGGDGDGGSLSAKILGNGSDTYNRIKLDIDNAVLLTQANAAAISNYIDADANTGKNDANRNTNGDVVIDTGNADVDVEVDNLANFNEADLDCGCLLDLTAKIAGNGDNSDNKIKADLDTTQEAFQDNEAALSNDVDADAKTGKNDAERNTGDPGSDPSVTTGDSDTRVSAENTANLNTLGDDAHDDLPEFDFDFDLNLSLGDLLEWLASHN